MTYENVECNTCGGYGKLSPYTEYEQLCEMCDGAGYIDMMVPEEMVDNDVPVKE